MSENVVIRTFDEQDRAELRALFGRRAGEGSPVASLWGHEESEAAIYLTPYMDREAGSLFVAVVDGAMVGYLTGCPDSSAFPSESARIDQAIRQHRLVLRRRPAAFFARSVLDIAGARIRGEPTAGDFIDPRWPAHLHIAVLPEARGTGTATALMNRWFERLRETDSPGCHLQTQLENTRAMRFFERMGFEKHGPSMPVPGMRYHGRRLHQQTMVRDSCSP